MFKRFSILVSLLIVIIIVAGCAPESAKPAAKSSLKLGVIPLIINLPAHVAQKEGLFEKQNLAVEIVAFRSTAEQESALLTGAVDGLLQHIFVAVTLNKNGETSKLVGACTMPGMYSVITSKESNIKNVSELKGKEIAVATNTPIDYALELLLMAKGLDAREIIKVNVPNMPLRLEMLNQGKVPAAILSSPLSDLAVLSGGTVVIDDKLLPLAGPGLIFSQGALKDKSNEISRFIKSWQQAVELINSKPENYRSLLREIARIPDPVSEKMPVPVFPKLGVPSEKEVLSTINWMMAKGVMSKRITYQAVVETKYVK